MEAGADWIHCDVMDGQFVPPITFGSQMVEGLRRLGDVPLEVHLMTLTPEAHFDAFAGAGCSRIIFHQEVAPHAYRLAQRLHSMGLQAGIALNPGTSALAIEPLLDLVDLALVMTVNPGWGGQEFIHKCLDKVRWLRERRADLNIEVDGGVDEHTIGEAMEAGANVFVTGNYVAHAPSPAGALAKLRQICGSK